MSFRTCCGCTDSNNFANNCCATSVICLAVDCMPLVHAEPSCHKLLLCEHSCAARRRHAICGGPRISRWSATKLGYKFKAIAQSTASQQDARPIKQAASQCHCSCCCRMLHVALIFESSTSSDRYRSALQSALVCKFELQYPAFKQHASGDLNTATPHANIFTADVSGYMYGWQRTSGRATHPA